MTWFLRKSNGVEYGPTDLETLRAWAADGRIAPDDLISRDHENWTPAPEEMLLEIEWIVEGAEGDVGGPFHLRTCAEWLREGVLPPDTVVRNARSGRRAVLGELFPEIAAAVAALAAAPAGVLSDTTSPVEAAPLSAPAGAAAAAPERVSWQALARERDALVDEARKWHELYDQLSTAARQRENELQTRLRDTEQELIRTQSALERAQQEIRQFRREREETATQGPSRDWAAAYFALMRAYDALSAELEQKLRELRALREEVATAKTAADERVKLADTQIAAERRAADEARRALAETEQAHESVLRSLRELNDRYIRLRERYAGGMAPGAATPAPPTPSAPTAAPAEQPSGERPPPPAPAGPKIRLMR